MPPHFPAKKASRIMVLDRYSHTFFDHLLKFISILGKLNIFTNPKLPILPQFLLIFKLLLAFTVFTNFHQKFTTVNCKNNLPFTNLMTCGVNFKHTVVSHESTVFSDK
jgi:hypothetical protein